MPFRFGEERFQSIYHGAVAVDGVYLGDEQIWPEGNGAFVRFNFATSASGLVTRLGSGSASFAFDAFARRVLEGQALFSFAANANGAVTRLGDGSAQFAFTAFAAQVGTQTGSGSATFTFSATGEESTGSFDESFDQSFG